MWMGEQITERGYEVVLELPATIESISKVKTYHQTHGLDEVLQADPSIDTTVNLELVKFTRSSGLNFSFVPNLFEAQARSVEVSSVRGIPVVVLKNSPLDGWGQVVKRVFDIIASLTCLCLTAPLFLGVWIAVRTGSKGPAIYSALRGGRGRDFMFFKFRSMYTHLSVGGNYGGEEAEKVRQQLWQVNDRGGKDAAFLKIKDDPRVTPVGKFIRRTKLDEIPQFWNVLRGDMSMVGPRAHVIDEVERYRSEYRRMFSIKPGIFGLSQVAQIGWPDLPFEEEIRLNTFYIENWSFWLDIRVLAQSFYLLFLARKPKADY
jgi:lipopolysaccharide/colanic/teichoic acid biosynthesis glycosyltransferase